MVLDNFFNWVFSPLINAMGHKWSLVVISFIITLFITIIYKLCTNQTLMKSLKSELKQLQKDVKKFKDNPDKMMKFNKEIMEKNLQYMKHSMKPLLFTFIPIIIIFGWLRKTFLPGGEFFSWGTKIPLFGTGMGWLLTYIVTSIIFSTLLRKILKIH